MPSELNPARIVKRCYRDVTAGSRRVPTPDNVSETTMKLSQLLLIAVFAIGCGTNATQRAPQTPAEAAIKAGEVKTSTDPAVNPNAAIMADFQQRVEKYAALH